MFWCTGDKFNRSVGSITCLPRGLYISQVSKTNVTKVLLEMCESEESFRVRLPSGRLDSSLDLRPAGLVVLRHSCQ